MEEIAPGSTAYRYDLTVTATRQDWLDDLLELEAETDKFNTICKNHHSYM
jgi:hypothetical protein